MNVIQNITTIKKWLFIIALLSLGTNLLGQNYTTRKTVSGKVKKLYEKAMEASSFEYDKAIALFEKVLKEDPTFIDAQIQYADLFYARKDFAKAEQEFEKVLEIDPTYNTKVLYVLGKVEMEQKKYEESAAHFKEYLESDSKNEVLLKRAEKLLENTAFLAEAFANPVPFSPQPISDKVNTRNAEYLPTLTADGEYLFYTRVVRGQEDFYLSKKINDDWSEGRPINELNTSLNEGAQTITANGREIVFTACDRKGGIGSCDLYYSSLKNGYWQPPVNLGFPINKEGWDGQPSLSANGEALYFSSKRKGGFGGRDIWVSYRQPDGNFGPPQNLGPEVNSDGNEEAPCIHPDGQTLYFMSNGHPGMGGSDLYLSRKTEEGTFGKPQNLGYPINTKAHEGAIFVGLDGKRAYFATDRTYSGDSTLSEKKARNQTDIYFFELPEKARPQPATYVKAYVYDVTNNQPLRATVDFIDLKSGKTVISSKTSEDGDFLLCLPAKNNYALNVSLSGYLFFSEHFDLSQVSAADEPFHLEIGLQPIKTAKETSRKPIVLKNVFFESGSADLKPESLTELNRLKGLMEENASLKIRINGHTDNVGSEEDNLQLSNDRAKAVTDYLIENGIESNRLEYKGFGEQIPIDTNESPEGRQRNRRTEFEVVK